MALLYTAAALASFLVGLLLGLLGYPGFYVLPWFMIAVAVVASVHGLPWGLLASALAASALALFPQFIHHGAGPAWLQVLILGALFAAIGLASDSAYATGSGRLRARLLARDRPRLPWRRLTGLLYIGLGLWAAFGGADRRASAMSR